MRFVPNVVSLLVTLGTRRWHVVEAIVPPNDVPMVHHVKQALVLAPKGVEFI